MAHDIFKSLQHYQALYNQIHMNYKKIISESIKGDKCTILKKGGQLFATHPLTNSQAEADEAKKDSDENKDDSDAAAEDRLKNGEKETDAESVASAASDAASDNQEEADENRFHEKLIALKNDPDPFFPFFQSCKCTAKADRRQQYSSNKIRKAQNEHLNIICKNLNHLQL